MGQTITMDPLEDLDVRRNAALSLAGVEFKGRGFRGGFFSGFYACKSPTNGPGWYIIGHNPAYGGTYTMLCARPDVPRRKHPHYNVAVRRGWRTLREARSVAEELNRRDSEFRPAFEALPLHGTRFPEGES